MCDVCELFAFLLDFLLLSVEMRVHAIADIIFEVYDPH